MTSSKSISKGVNPKFRNMTGGQPYDLNAIQYANFGGGMGAYNNQANYAAINQPVSRLSPVKGNLTIVIVNSSSTTQTVTLFNVAFGGTSPTFADNVSVTCRQSNYTAVLNSISANPFRLAGLKYLVRDKTQFSNTFTLGSRDFLGAGATQAYTAQDNTSAMNNIETELDDPNFIFDININSYIAIDVNGTDTVTTTGEQVTLVFTMAGLVDSSAELTAKPTLYVNPAGYNPGIPSVPLVISGPQGVNTQAPAYQGGYNKNRLFG